MRTPNGMVPTELGAIYIEHARTAIKAMEDAALKVARLRPGPRVLRLQVPPIFGDRWLLPRFSQFTEAHPDIEVQFTTFVSKTQTEIPDGSVRFLVKPAADEEGVYLLATMSASSVLHRIGKAWQPGLNRDGVTWRHAGTSANSLPLGFLREEQWQRASGSTAHNTFRLLYHGYQSRAGRQGMALIPHGLIVDELATGRLVNPEGLGYQSDHGYWFTKPAMFRLVSRCAYLSNGFKPKLGR